jgi:APA family basic amino acid/polyamine antiporter
MKKTIGIWRSWALVAGMMIGSGILTMPALLAGYGSYSFIGWAVTGFGAICLALTYSYLSSRKPGLGGHCGLGILVVISRLGSSSCAGVYGV